MKSKVETITPDIARKYLKSNNRNRFVRERAVEQYAKDMKLGNWLTTHQGIAFAENGDLIDGQHRLLAIIESGCSIPMLVTTGLPSSHRNGVEVFTMDVIDTNRTRTVGDQLHLMHEVSNGTKVAAACAVIAWICTSGKVKLTTPQAVAILEIYGKAISEMHGLLSHFKPASVAPVVGTLAFCSVPYTSEASAFAADLVSGENIKKGMPVFALRNYLINGGTVARTWTSHKETLIESVANAFHNAVNKESIVLIKRGALGLNFFRAKQRTNVEKVRLKLGIESRP